MASDAFSATMMVGAFVLHDGTNGITESIDDPQAIDAANPEIGRRHGIVARTHRAGADRMVIRLARPVGILHQVFLTPDAVAGQPFGKHEWSQRWLLKDIAGKLQPLQRALPVVWIRPVLGSMRGAAAGSALASRTVPRERGRRNAEFNVTPGLRIAVTPASMPDPSPRWN